MGEIPYSILFLEDDAINNQLTAFTWKTNWFRGDRNVSGYNGYDERSKKGIIIAYGYSDWGRAYGVIYSDIKPAAYRQVFKTGYFNNKYYEIYVEGSNFGVTSECWGKDGIIYEYIIA